MVQGRRQPFGLGALALAAAAGVAAVPGVAGAAGTSGGNGAGAATPATLTGIKAKATTEITRRVNSLNAAIAKVNAAKGLGVDQATLAAYLGADISPLQQLDTKIQGDTSVQEAAQDFANIFGGYRVYLLVLPVARIAAVADRATTTALPALTADEAKAQAHENAANQGELQPLLNDLQTQIATATNATNGLATTVLAYTPAEWNGNHELLSGVRGSARTAAAALKQGRRDLVQMRQDLGGGKAGADGSARGGAAGKGSATPTTAT